MAHVGVQTDKTVSVPDRRTLACQTQEVMEDAEQMVSVQCAVGIRSKHSA